MYEFLRFWAQGEVGEEDGAVAGEEEGCKGEVDAWVEFSEGRAGKRKG